MEFLYALFCFSSLMWIVLIKSSNEASYTVKVNTNIEHSTLKGHYVVL